MATSKGIVPGTIGAQASPVFIPQAQKNLNAAGLSSATDAGVIDINNVGAGNTSGVKNSTVESQTTGTQKNGVAPSPTENLTDFQKYQQGLMSVEDYHASVEATSNVNSESEQNKFALEKKAADQAIKTDAVAKDITAKIGDPPTPTDTKGMTPEEINQAKLDDQIALTEYYKKYGETSQAQLGDVSGQVASFSDQLTQYKGALDALQAQLNTSDPSAGSALQTALDSAKQANSGSLTPEALAQIQTLVQGGASASEITVGVSKILGNSADLLPMTGWSASASGYTKTLSNGNEVTIPTGVDGKITSNPLDIPAGVSGLDLFMLEYATTVQNADISAQQTLRTMQTAWDSANRSYDTAVKTIQDMVANGQTDAAFEMGNSISALQAQRRADALSESSDLASITEEESKTEAYWSGQLEAWGAGESTAALSLMTKNKLSFISQKNSIQQQYDTKGLRYDELEVQARQGYVNAVTRLASEGINKTSEVTNGLFDSLDMITENTQASYENRDMKIADALVNYRKNVYTEQETLRKEQLASFEKAQDRQFEAIASGINASGGVVSIGPDGLPTYMLDSKGNPVKSLDRQQLDAQLSKYEGVVIDGKLIRWNPYDNSTFTPSDNGMSDSSFTGLDGGVGLSFSVNGQGFTVGSTFGPEQNNNSECVGGARLFNGDLPRGLDTLQDKRNIYSGLKTTSEVQAGDTVFFKTKAGGARDEAGHAATIVAKNDSNNKALIIESNFYLDNKWSLREIDLNTIDKDPVTGNLGVFRGTQPNEAALQDIWNDYNKETFFTDIQRQEASAKYGENYITGVRASSSTANLDSNEVLSQLNIVSQGRSETQRGENESTLLSFIESGDSEGATNYLDTLAYGKMAGKQLTNYNMFDTIGSESSILANKINSGGIAFNIEPSYWNNLIQKNKLFLDMENDPNLTEFRATVNTFNGEYTNAIYGANLTGGELEKAEAAIISDKDNMSNILVKLNNMSQFAERYKRRSLDSKLGIRNRDYSKIGNEDTKSGSNVKVKGPDGKIYLMSSDDANMAVKEGGKIIK